jgi:hypothetical protein
MGNRHIEEDGNALNNYQGKIIEADADAALFYRGMGLARDVEIQLLATSDYRGLATGKTDAAGMYAFKVPDVGYHVVATGDKAHIATLASVDIW